jgi:hypothetical protein
MAGSEEEDVTEEEARELFEMMRSEYQEMISTPVERRMGLDQLDEDFDDDETVKLEKESPPHDNVENSSSRLSVNPSTGVSSFAQSSAMTGGSSAFPQQLGTSTKLHTAQYEWGNDMEPLEGDDELLNEDLARVPTFTDNVEILDDKEVAEVDYQLEILREALPLFPENRLVKIQKVFQKSLNEPSMLELVPLVREVMPDYITNTWLKKMSALTAKFVMHKAKEDGLVDKDMMNSVLSLHASSGSIDRTLDFHQVEFQEHGMQPNDYSNRLVVQMLLNNNRLPRALDFKRKVEESGRPLDLKAYGSLVEYAGSRKQLGTAMLLLKECIKVHGASPGERSLANVRILSRHAGKDMEASLVELVGPDPNAWVKDLAVRRRYKHRKGAHGNSLQQARNQLVRLTG